MGTQSITHPEDEVKRGFNNAHRLLLISGGLIGLNFPMGKMAIAAGVPPLLWSATVSIGVVLLLMPINLIKRRLTLPSRNVLRYTLLSAPISFVIPNLLIYTSMPHLGAGYVGLMFALSPVFTLLFASRLGMRTPGTAGLLGIGIGLVGAITISISQGANPLGPDKVWLVMGLGIPMALATGNITRSLYWPEGEEPAVLAFWGHSLSSLLCFILILAQYHRVPIEAIEPVGHIALAQMLISGLTFQFVYRLQRTGGPVLLSQMGYVAAAVGLGTATLFLGEHYGLATWLGAGIIALGILFTIKDQQH